MPWAIASAGRRRETAPPSIRISPETFPLEVGTWHTLKIAVHGTALQGYLDGKLVLEHTLTESVSGKIGVWSKTDSMVEFDDFTVTPTVK